MPNPHDPNNPMYVYCPWSAEDVKKATEGILHPQVNVQAFEQGLRNLHESFRLNESELETAVSQIVVADWCMISENWNPNDGQGCAIEYPHKSLNQRLTQFIYRTKNRYQARANWTKIN